MTEIPRGMYGTGMDGLQDPKRATLVERERTTVARLQEERRRRRSMSPLVSALQRATDRAFMRR